MIKTFIAVLGALVLTTGAAAQAPPAAPALHPLPSKGLKWLHKPTGRDIAAVYPQRAIDRAMSGRILIECQTTAQGFMSACKVLSETPEGFGFGEAALKLSQGFRLDPGTVSLEGGVILLPIILIAPDGVPPPLGDETVGQPAALATVSKTGRGSPCPTSDHAGARCTLHAFSWEEQPNLIQAAPLVRAAVGDNPSTVIICRVRDGQLADCLTGPGASPQQEAAMRGLSAMLKPPVQAQDKTPTADGDVMIEFHWAALRRILDNSVLTGSR